MSKLIDNYVLQQVIGQGQYGKVYKAFHIKTNATVAVKVIKLDRFKQVPKLNDFTINEINTLTKVKNANVIGFVEMMRTMNNIYLVYDYCNGGNLEQYVHKQGYLKETEALHIFGQLIEAFKDLVKENILHRDLKPSNILLHEGKIKVADFGFCKSLQGQMDLTQTMVGSPIYMAPEILRGEPYSLSADIWSLGVCLFEILFGRCPFEETTIPRLMFQIQNKPLEIPKHIQKIGEGTEWLLRRMLTVDPNQRIQWNELFEIQSLSSRTPRHLQQSQRNNRSPSPDLPHHLTNSNNNKNHRSPSPIAKAQGKSPSRVPFGTPKLEAKKHVAEDERKYQPLSPVRMNSSPYLGVYHSNNNKPIYGSNLTQKHEPTQKTHLSNGSSETKPDLDVKSCLNQILTRRSQITSRMNLLNEVLEINDNGRVPMVSYLMLKSIIYELEKLKNEIVQDDWSLQNWREFKQTVQYERCLKIIEEDLYKIRQTEDAFKLEVDRCQSRRKVEQMIGGQLSSECWSYLQLMVVKGELSRLQQHVRRMCEMLGEEVSGMEWETLKRFVLSKQ